ncbi:hypothetical protein F5Y10DRAFT_250186 [Nemania abortiva]|nr:hypothetical protein F5Y10DRAFT_250186 [Nemania abortiva]
MTTVRPLHAWFLAAYSRAFLCGCCGWGWSGRRAAAAAELMPPLAAIITSVSIFTYAWGRWSSPEAEARVAGGGEDCRSSHAIRLARNIH